MWKKELLNTFNFFKFLFQGRYYYDDAYNCPIVYFFFAYHYSVVLHIMQNNFPFKSHEICSWCICINYQNNYRCIPISI
jgi:hypothetical protein